MRDFLVAALMLTGTFFMLLAGLGIIRMPDLFLRMSTTTKAATLGAGSLLLAAAAHFDDLAATGRALATIVFLLLTAPVAAHTIGRAAFLTKVPLVNGTVLPDASRLPNPAPIKRPDDAQPGNKASDHRP